MLGWLSHVGRSRTLQNAVKSVNVVVVSRRRGACNDPVKRVNRERLKYRSNIPPACCITDDTWTESNQRTHSYCKFTIFKKSGIGFIAPNSL